MRVKALSFEGKEACLIFITSQEKQQDEIKSKIEYYRNKFDYVSIFVSGNNSIEKLLREIMN